MELLFNFDLIGKWIIFTYSLEPLMTAMELIFRFYLVENKTIFSIVRLSVKTTES